MLEGTRPIDQWMLIIELLVLVLIAYEVGAGVWRAIQTHRRVKAIFQRMSLGQDLQSKAPSGGTDEPTATAWVNSVKTWMQETYNLLARYSPQAAASFVHDQGGASVQYSGITGNAQARDWYRTLISRINNLRGIMEKPEIYF